MHFSLDIETLSLKPNAAILSVALVPFDRIVVREGYLYEVVDLAEYNRYSGFHIDPVTVRWWLDPKRDAARTALPLQRAGSLHTVLSRIQNFLDRHSIDGIWGNGAGFDNVILRHAFERLDMVVPWSYRQDRDMRTICSLGVSERSFNNPLPHDALADARYQAHVIQSAMKKLHLTQENNSQ